MKAKTKRPTTQRGVSLVETLIVIVTIAFVLLAVLPRFSAWTNYHTEVKFVSAIEGGGSLGTGGFNPATLRNLCRYFPGFSACQTRTDPTSNMAD